MKRFPDLHESCVFVCTGQVIKIIFSFISYKHMSLIFPPESTSCIQCRILHLCWVQDNIISNCFTLFRIVSLALRSRYLCIRAECEVKIFLYCNLHGKISLYLLIRLSVPRKCISRLFIFMTSGQVIFNFRSRLKPLPNLHKLYTWSVFLINDVVLLFLVPVVNACVR